MRTTIATRLSFAAISVMLSLLFGTLMAGTVMAQGNNSEGKTTICHATNSAKNPYVMITVSNSAINGEKKNDHSHHTGPVFNPDVHDQQNRGWGDIIPPVEGVNPGQNWDAEGQAVYNNDCALAAPPSTPPSTPPTGTPGVPNTALNAPDNHTPLLLLAFLALLSAGALMARWSVRLR